MYYTLYNPDKMHCHQVGINTESLEDLRSDIIDYILTGTFTPLERSTISSMTLKMLTELIDYRVVQTKARIPLVEITHFKKMKHELVVENISQMKIHFGRKYIFDYVGVPL